MHPPKSLSALTLVVLLFASTRSLPIGAGDSIPFITIAKGRKSEIRTLAQIVIHTPTEWRDLWRKHSTGLAGTALPLPEVDFSREMVIAVFAGEVRQLTRVSVLKVSREKDRLVVLVQIASSQPGPVPVEPGTSTPFHIIRLLQRSRLPVIFMQAKTPEKDICELGREYFLGCPRQAGAR